MAFGIKQLIKPFFSSLIFASLLQFDALLRFLSNFMILKAHTIGTNSGTTVFLGVTLEVLLEMPTVTVAPLVSSQG